MLRGVIVKIESKILVTLFLASIAVAVPLNGIAATVTVFAAASLSETLKEIASAYEKTSRDKIVFNFGASSLLARQIEAGAPADVFFSADEAKMDELEKKGLILKETRVSRVSNSLVLVVAADNGAAITNATDLATEKVKRLAIAETQTVPAGIYAKEYLQNVGLWQDVKSKVVPTENVRGALAAVEAGNVEAGIVYKTDAAISKKVRVAYQIPARDSPAISYPVAVVKDARDVRAAKEFTTHLATDAATAVFKKFGFMVRD
jgi:molybdate transport system substrate-binding protein